MIDKEMYKKGLVRMWDSMRNSYFKGKETCLGVKCEECPLYQFADCSLSINLLDIYNIVEKWAKENQPKKFKVSRLEYDILKSYFECLLYGHFFEHETLMALLEKGYFKGADEKMNIEYYFNNCEVVDDD